MKTTIELRNSHPTVIFFFFWGGNWFFPQRTWAAVNWSKLNCRLWFVLFFSFFSPPSRWFHSFRYTTVYPWVCALECVGLFCFSDVSPPPSLLLLLVVIVVCVVRLRISWDSVSLLLLSIRENPNSSSSSRVPSCCCCYFLYTFLLRPHCLV